jgi:alpha-beta hydrolase superfamily lysophospholipase
MNKKPNQSNDPQDYIIPLDMNGLHGRMLHLPPLDTKKKREILLVYGMHSSLERCFTLAQSLNHYGAVTIPDIPGHGGMESFRKIGIVPSIDALADYLASFIKLRYRNRRLTVAGMSLGFVIVTRMLQKYPELNKKIDFVVSLVGFTHKDDFKFKRTTTFTLKTLSRFYMMRGPAWFFRYVILQPMFISAGYNLLGERNHKMKGADKLERKKRINFEIHLWHCNDIRTYMMTTYAMMTLDLTTAQVPLPVYHISVDADQYFDNAVVEQHMRCIYSDYIEAKAYMPNHAPTVISDAEEAGLMIPPMIRELLAGS